MSIALGGAALVPDDVIASFQTGRAGLPGRDVDDLRSPEEIAWEEDDAEETAGLDDESAGEVPLSSLPLRVRLGYAFGEVGVFSSNAILSYYLTPFLLDVALLPASAVALIQLGATAFDAVTDLAFGLVTDGTRSDLGRRRPYILLGAVIWSGMFLGLFQSPTPMGLAARLAYYIIMLLLYRGTNTIYAVPYYSLISEITPSYTERTRLSGLRLVISLVSSALVNFGWAVVSTAFPLSDAPDQPDLQLGYAAAAVLFVPFIVLPAVGVFTQVVEPTPKPGSRERRMPFRQLAASVFANHPFVLVVLVYTCAYLSINFVQNNLLLWVKYVVRVPDQFRWAVLVLQTSACLSTFVWVPVATRLGKRLAYLIGCIPFTVLLALSWFIDPSVSYLLYVMAFVAGGCVGALLLIPWSMMADCIDVDELRTGKRREGIFFATFILSQKFALAGALAASNYTLAATGYINHPPGSPNADFQPDAVITALKVMVGPVGASIALLSLLPAFFYPLSKKKHQEIRDQLLAARRKTAVTRRTTRRLTKKTGRQLQHDSRDGHADDIDHHSHDEQHEYEALPLNRSIIKTASDHALL